MGKNTASLFINSLLNLEVQISFLSMTNFRNFLLVNTNHHQADPLNLPVMNFTFYITSDQIL